MQCKILQSIGSSVVGVVGCVGIVGMVGAVVGVVGDSVVTSGTLQADHDLSNICPSGHVISMALRTHL